MCGEAHTTTVTNSMRCARSPRKHEMDTDYGMKEQQIHKYPPFPTLSTGHQSRLWYSYNHTNTNTHVWGYKYRTKHKINPLLNPTYNSSNWPVICIAFLTTIKLNNNIVRRTHQNFFVEAPLVVNSRCQAFLTANYWTSTRWSSSLAALSASSTA